MLDEPLSYELLRELTLRLALSQTLLVAVGIEVAAGIWCMDLVDEVELAVAFAKFIFGVDEDQTVFGCNLLSALEEFACPVLDDSIVLFGVMMGSGKRSFSCIPSGNFTPQSSRHPSL